MPPTTVYDVYPVALWKAGKVYIAYHRSNECIDFYRYNITLGTIETYNKMSWVYFAAMDGYEAYWIRSAGIRRNMRHFLPETFLEELLEHGASF